MVRLFLETSLVRLGEHLGLDVPFVLTNGSRQAGQSTKQVTLYLTVSVSLNTASHPGMRDLVGTGEAMRPSMAQDSMKSTRSTVAAGFETLSYPKDHLPGEIATSMPPMADGNAGMSPTENALRNLDEATTTINLWNTWEGALERIKWVMDTVSTVAEVRAMSFLLVLD